MWQGRPVRYVGYLLAGTILFWLPYGVLDHPAFYGVPLVTIVLIILLPTAAAIGGSVYLRRRYPEHSVAIPLLMLLGILNVGPFGIAADIFPGSPGFPGLDLSNLVRYAGEVWDEFPFIAFAGTGGRFGGFLALSLTTGALLLLAISGIWSSQIRPALLAHGGVNWESNVRSLFTFACRVGLAGLGVAVFVAASWWGIFTFEPFKHDTVTFDVPRQCKGKEPSRIIESTVLHRWEGDVLEATVSESVNCAYSTKSVSAQIFGDRIFLRVKYHSPSGRFMACKCEHATIVRLSSIPMKDYHLSLISWP